MVIRGLSVYAQYLFGQIEHYRESNGFEYGAVMRLDNGKYALIEAKLGGEGFVNEGRKSLLFLSQKIRSSGEKDHSL